MPLPETDVPGEATAYLTPTAQGGLGLPVPSFAAFGLGLALFVRGMVARPEGFEPPTY